MERIVGELGGDGGAAAHSTLPDGSALIDGLALVTDINEQFGLHIDEETYTTPWRLHARAAGTPAQVGDTLGSRARTLRVEALDGLRVARVFLSKSGSRLPRSCT